jgi:hypothetical protein
LSLWHGNLDVIKRRDLGHQCAFRATARR